MIKFKRTILFIVIVTILKLTVCRACRISNRWHSVQVTIGDWRGDLKLIADISHSDVDVNLVFEKNTSLSASTEMRIEVSEPLLDIQLLTDYDEYNNPVVYAILINGENICDRPGEIVVQPESPQFHLPPPSVTTQRVEIVRPTPPPYIAANTLPDECGITIPQVKPFIHYGTTTTASEFPWHAAIFDYPAMLYRCGGTLVSHEMVITAAHCVVEPGTKWRLAANALVVVLGKDQLTISSVVEQKMAIAVITVHCSFNPNNFHNDIAALKLSGRVEYSNFVRPVCLWPYKNDRINSIVDHVGLIPGFGYNEHWQLTDNLASVKMPVVSYETCIFSNPNLYARIISESNFCAGYRNGSSVCNGDSGGGMVFKIDSLYYLRGIVSIGAPDNNHATECSTRNFIVFTDVAKFIDWISMFSQSGK